MISFFKLYEKIIGFGKAESKGVDDGVPPAMAQIIGRMMEQDAKWKNSFRKYTYQTSDKLIPAFSKLFLITDRRI